jgi:dihydroorotate dehydrogenase
MLYRLVKFFLFLMPPEQAHEFALKSLRTALKLPVFGSWLRSSFRPKSSEPIQVGGISFPNPVGLAAGFDKDAKWLHLLKDLGFGFVEVGTVTPKPQEGNPKPRLFRLPSDRALINRMGFNNQGLDAMVQRLKNRPQGLIVGGNIGKNKVTPNQEAVQDYILGFEALYDHVDYIAVNISSPNTPGLRDLQEEGFIVGLFEELQKRRETKNSHKPIWIKIAPDFSNDALHGLVETLKKARVDGIIVSNTTVSREGLSYSDSYISNIGAGGLSGAPVFETSNRALAEVALHAGGEIPLIGVGGIFNAYDANEKFLRGAQLVQVYTGFIYEGPWIVKNIIKGLKSL